MSTPNSSHRFDVRKIADLPFYTEGPCVDSRGNIYCTTLSGGSILKWDADGKLTEWARSACPNGQTICPNDDHLICDVSLRSVRRFDAAGQFVREEVIGRVAGSPLFCPNDLTLDSKGNIYFTDSVRETGKVYFLGVSGEQGVLAEDLDYPNGLVLSEDEQFLFVAESYKNRILKMGLNGRTHKGKEIPVFIDLPKHPSGRPEDNLPDGLAMLDGNLWVAHYGMQAVHQITHDGTLGRSFDTGLPLTSNLCFMKDGVLLVTGGYGEPGPGALIQIRSK